MQTNNFLTNSKHIKEDDNFIYIPLSGEKNAECLFFRNSKFYTDNIFAIEKIQTPQELLGIAVKKLNNKIKSMPNFVEVFQKHVKECGLEDKDPFAGFTMKAIMHWNMWDDYDEYLTAYNKFSESTNPVPQKTSDSDQPCSFGREIKLLNNNMGKLSIC
jgi:hypothetical protein